MPERIAGNYLRTPPGPRNAAAARRCCVRGIRRRTGTSCRAPAATPTRPWTGPSSTPSRSNAKAAHARENRRRWAWADPLDMGGSRPEGYRLRTAISVVPRNIDGSQKGNMQSARGQTVVIRSGSFRVQRCGQWLGSAHETMLARELQRAMRTNS